MTIYFKNPDSNFGWLANFSNHSIFLKNKEWKTVEHYYQAQKFAGTELENIIHSLPTPEEAKAMAVRYKTKRKKNWDSIKTRIMFNAIEAKFTQNNELKNLLIETGNQQIIEKTDDDNFWGCGYNKKGENMMGILLMKLRENLKKEETLLKK